MRFEEEINSRYHYHSAFMTYPRHHRPENIASTPDVLDTLLKGFSSRARVDSQKNWNSTIESWTSSKNKLSILSLPPLTQESNVGDDGLMSQSSFDVNITLVKVPMMMTKIIGMMI